MVGVLRIMALLLAVITVSAASECLYGPSPPVATIGQKMVIECNQLICFGGVFEWCKVNGAEFINIQDETSDKLVVSENVTSATEVGGQQYECHCSGNCTKYKIAVEPRVNLSLSPKVVMVGSSVDVICRAESYPPANSEGNYQMRHPQNKNISQMLLEDGSGVLHQIQAANKKEDTGEYECTVTLTLSDYGEPIQSKLYKANLTVYDPPTIVGVRNFTLTSFNQQSAVLECVVKDTEHGLLEVWVNWTLSTGLPITAEHTTSQNGDTFYLLLYSATPGEYSCNLFSTYSLGEPDDTATASVKNGSGTFCDCRNMEQTKDAVIISAVLSIAIIGLLVIIISFFIVKVVKKQRGVRASLQTHEMEQPNDEMHNGRYVGLTELNGRATSKNFAENKSFDKKDLEGDNLREGSVENTGTPPPTPREDTLSSTELSLDPHTELSPQVSQEAAEPEAGKSYFDDEYDENDDVFPLASPGNPGVPPVLPLPRDRADRPRSASRRLSGTDYHELPEETFDETTAPAQPSRPGSASKSGRRRSLSLSQRRSSASLDPVETEFLLTKDAVFQPKTE